VSALAIQLRQGVRRRIVHDRRRFSRGCSLAAVRPRRPASPMLWMESNPSPGCTAWERRGGKVCYVGPLHQMKPDGIRAQQRRRHRSHHRPADRVGFRPPNNAVQSLGCVTESCYLAGDFHDGRESDAPSTRRGRCRDRGAPALESELRPGRQRPRDHRPTPWDTSRHLQHGGAVSRATGSPRCGSRSADTASARRGNPNPQFVGYFDRSR
jgi:hypothetical protein